MRIKSKFIAPIAIGALALSLVACASETDTGADGGETFKLKLASYNINTSMEGKATQAWADEVREKTDGRVDIEFFFQEALISGAETLAGVADGRADLGYIAGAYYPGELPLSAVAGLPFTANDMKAQGLAFQELYETDDAYKAEWESQGVKVLIWAPVAENILALTEPASSVDDLANKKIRGYGYVSQTLDLAGASPVSMGQGEVYEALQRGVLDGTSGAPLDVMADRDFYEVAPNLVDMNFGNYAIAANVINLDLWNSLPGDLQDIITEVSEGYLDNYLDVVAEAQEAACTEILEGGGNITVFDWSDMKGFASETRAAVLDVWKSDVQNNAPGVDSDSFFSTYEDALIKHGDSDDVQSVTALCAARQ